jgi:hypothetical protein
LFNSFYEYSFNRLDSLNDAMDFMNSE